MRTARRCLPLLSAAFIVAFSWPAAAWSPEGHQIVARLAASQLTKGAAAQVEDLLGDDADDAMAKASTFADELAAKRSNTKAWHFVNIPVAETAYSAERDCADGNCAVARLAADMKILADKAQPKAARAEALKFMIGLMADIHQPLRCSEYGNGHGAGVKVSIGGRTTNLLAVWDADIIKAMQLDVPQTVSLLSSKITPGQRKAWSRGTLVGWCEESAKIAKSGAYDDLSGAATENGAIVLAVEYPDAKVKMTAEQLKKAGVRLAAAVNFALK